MYIECPRRRRVRFDNLQETISKVSYSGLLSSYYRVPATLTIGRPTIRSIAMTCIGSVSLGRTSYDTRGHNANTEVVEENNDRRIQGRVGNAGPDL